MSLGVTAALTGLAAGERLFAAAVGGLAERGLPGHERLWRPLGHLAAVSALGGALYGLLRRVDHRIEHGAERLEAAYEHPPTSRLVSGSPGSAVAWETLSRQGRRNVANVVRAEAIEQVMGEPAAAEPIRVVVGLESAPTETERVALALAELERTGAFDRGLLMVISPTGTGYVNYVATEAAAYLTRGNLASVTMQYSLRPSPLSLDRVAEGRRQYRMLIDAIHNALAWLGLAAARAATVPGAQQWRSPTTFVQTLVDMKNAANVIPGQFEAKGHDYRADLARFIREVYALEASDDQPATVERALRAAELDRKRLLDAATAAKDQDGQAGGSESSSSNAASRS